MKPNAFTETDEKRYVEALNWIAQNAKFGESAPDIQFMLAGYKHFSFLQSLIPKINSNILQDIKLHETPKEEKPKKTRNKKGK